MINQGGRRQSLRFALLQAGVILCSAVLSTGGQDIPFEVKEYLAKRNVLVSGSEMVIEHQAVRVGEADPDEAAALLKAYGVPVVRKLASDLTIIRADSVPSQDLNDVMVQLGAHASPVLKSLGARFRVIPLQRVVFRLRDKAAMTDLNSTLSSFDLTEPRRLRECEYAVDFGPDADQWSSLKLAARLSKTQAIKWAVPDCARETSKHYLPNDYSSALWHLHNTNTVSWTNDTALTEAWNTTLGAAKVVIAILDDGIDIGHPDLSANMWTNAGEIPGDGLDNDGNGYIDDVNGWDFYKGTNVIVPTQTNENHGTAVAGIAAARGNNNTGICAPASLCRILPVKIYSGDDFVTDSQWADAVDYAARYAQVISISTGTDLALSNQLISAFNRASTTSLIFASAGNDADLGFYALECAPDTYALYGWYWDQTNISSSGPHTYRWAYEKDSTVSIGEDCAWLDSVQLPDGRIFDFEDGSLPSGWSTGGDATWFASPEKDDHMAVGAYSMRSGEITNNENSWIQVTNSGAGTLTFYYQVFGERVCNGSSDPVNYDYLTFAVDGVTNWEDVTEDPASANWGLDYTAVLYPAALTSVVAVGASAIDGYRTPYSCFDMTLEILAPVGGATWEPGITTTDRRGSDGYSTSDYYNAFSGSSASAPLAAGIAGLLFSANPWLSPHEARTIIRQSARRIGSATYTNGFNPRYGYGQIDAASAMRLMLSNMPPSFIATA
ncbi:MAG: S8 family serine peptidase, partial [Thermodesulfobacteriota bacterium]|nr:S8 family serine peptidase [Thermodesulfobacteriota bacterium]